MRHLKITYDQIVLMLNAVNLLVLDSAVLQTVPTNEGKQNK